MPVAGRLWGLLFAEFCCVVPPLDCPPEKDPEECEDVQPSKGVAANAVHNAKTNTILLAAIFIQTSCALAVGRLRLTEKSIHLGRQTTRGTSHGDQHLEGRCPSSRVLIVRETRLWQQPRGLRVVVWQLGL